LIAEKLIDGLMERIIHYSTEK